MSKEFKMVPVELLERIVNLNNSFADHRQAQHDLVKFLAQPVDQQGEPPEATQDCHDDDLGDGEAERMQRKATNESTAYDGFDNGVD
ncbi:hypothetical protein [Pseudomonas viridiflava]|uniref:hypothetical protein n=1 Tax=Pseudomonas viridiflava TaxID=33069 RepID=UPI001C318F50|nr:hypothetical protein [Pseudomonas viridiflava]QXG34001.1 hypothetical protein KTT61_18165 [Pseudomonas viridiflava]